MQTNCKNCKTIVEGNFCSECGQKAKTQRINYKYLQEEFKYTFFHINSGFFYTIKSLLTRPGYMIREFIEGQRIRHYKPILLLFVLAGLYGFLLHYVNLGEMINQSELNSGPVKMGDMLTWMQSHYSLVEIIYLPIIALSSWLAFKSWGYNFMEHVILNAYVASLRLIVSLLSLPFLMLFDNLGAFMVISGLLSSVTILLTGWSYCQFFDDRPIGPTIIRVLVMTVILTFISMFLSIVATIIYMQYFYTR